MGRHPSKNSNLPPKVRARKRGAKTWYYYDTGGKPRKEIPLGSDYALALKKWAELKVNATPRHPNIITFRYVAERYIKEIIPGKARATQKDNLRELKQLYLWFDNPPAPLDLIKPINIRQYLDRRNNIRANREKALFSHIWNKAREWGYTDLANPCAGITGKRETGRKDTYIEDKMFDAVHRVASVPLQDAMTLAYLTGQRLSDMLKMRETDIIDGAIQVTQEKTNKKLRINIEGELSALINKILARKSKYKIRSLYLIVDETGQRFTYSMLRGQFDKARQEAGISKESFQFRDLRAKAGTDKAESSGDIRQAQKQLGHTTVTMTEHYVRGRKGDKVTPTK